jgi:pimeloyl-ACP methyl ester carboxylesterase
MGAHTAVAKALRNPERVAGLAIVGPSYTAPLGDEALVYWDGIAAALEDGGVDGFVAFMDRHQTVEATWRDSVLRFTRERMLRHRQLDAVARALREVPRSQPFEGLASLRGLDVPALVVASHDDADPGHPHAVAVAYAEALPQAQLVSEEKGRSPLAWQGGRLSRAIAAFAARL